MLNLKTKATVIAIAIYGPACTEDKSGLLYAVVDQLGGVSDDYKAHLYSFLEEKLTANMRIIDAEAVIYEVLKGLHNAE